MADSNNDLITRITPGGVPSTFATLPTHDNPIGVTFDGNNNLFVVDDGSSKVSEITPGGVISTLATGVGITTTPAFIVVAPVPEPTIFATLSVALTFLVGRRRRR